MSENSKIEWCKHTWSPWRGCTKVSPGCTNCYADATAKRNPKSLGVWGPNGKRVVNADWKAPLKWNRQAEKAGERWRIFPSMCDPFEDFDGAVTNCDSTTLWACEKCGHVIATSADSACDCREYRRMTLADVRRQFVNLLYKTPSLDWLVLTKRPENALRMLAEATLYAVPNPSLPYPQPNLWVGTSVENSDFYCRIDALRAVPAAIRFLSLEPLLGPLPNLNLDGIHWVIIGGESGPKARPCNAPWIRDIVRQCKAASIPAFVKQLGKHPIFSIHEGIGRWNPDITDPKGGDWNEWPEALRVREFPQVEVPHA